MVQLIFMSLSTVMSMTFLFMKHPLAMGMVLLIQTSLICFVSSHLYKTFWFSYILFLVFLGGMLVLFVYVISLASNEMFSINLKIYFYSMIFLGLLFVISLAGLNFFNPMEFNNEMEMISSSHSLSMENSLDLMKLYNFPSSMITILLVNYLLITLIASVKITNLFYGPLRKMI